MNKNIIKKNILILLVLLVLGYGFSHVVREYFILHPNNPIQKFLNDYTWIKPFIWVFIIAVFLYHFATAIKNHYKNYYDDYYKNYYENLYKNRQ